MIPESRQQIKNLLVNQVKYEQFSPANSNGNPVASFPRHLSETSIPLETLEPPLDNDIIYFHSKFSRDLDFFNSLSESRKIAMIALCIPDGIKWILDFSEMMLFLKCHDYAGAAETLKESEWGMQNADRAAIIADIIRNDRI